MVIYNLFLGIDKTIVDQAINYNKLFEGMKKEFRVIIFFNSVVRSYIQTPTIVKRNQIEQLEIYQYVYKPHPRYFENDIQKMREI